MKMTAAVMYEQGLQRPFSESQPLKIETVDLDGPGEGEVLVQIAAAGLCHSDLSAIKGLRPRAMPTVVGHEAAGVVVETGTGVSKFVTGDHVVMVFVASCGRCSYCSSGRPNLCQSSWKARSEGTLQSGARRLRINGKPLNHYSGISAFAEYAVVSETSLVKIPKELPLTTGGDFWMRCHHRCRCGSQHSSRRRGEKHRDCRTGRDRIVGLAGSRSRGRSYHHCDRHQGIETRTRKGIGRNARLSWIRPRLRGQDKGGHGWRCGLRHGNGWRNCSPDARLCHRTAGQYDHLRRSSTSRRDISCSTSRTGF